MITYKEFEIINTMLKAKEEILNLPEYVYKNVHYYCFKNVEEVAQLVESLNSKNYIEGNTVIGEDCAIGPDVRFTNMKVGNRVTAQFSYCHEAEICDGVTLGPYVHLRPGTTIGENVKIGNFVEVKNSTIGEGSKLPHLQYIGDTDMGSGVNVGCGSVTCNYDGKQKFRTKIGDNVFIGCNTNLVAPVNVEDGAYIAAGSTITKDVPKDSLAIGRARQTNIEVWNDKRKV